LAALVPVWSGDNDDRTHTRICRRLLWPFVQLGRTAPNIIRPGKKRAPPKEDPLHRFQWREAYPVEWMQDFSRFCSAAKSLNIDVVAGVAPGLDFDFKDLPAGNDYQLLLKKCRALLSAGAKYVSLLLDDIDENFNQRSGSFASEGCAHASLANRLGDDLSQSLWVTPRVYANELFTSDLRYLPDFLNQLETCHSVLYCGSDVVARIADSRSVYECAAKSDHIIVLWDNLYANDYCPRRLFVGPWEGREAATNILLNPTGMVETDCLLLDLMSHELKATTAEYNSQSQWEITLREHGVPEAFFELTEYFYHPVFNDGPAVKHVAVARMVQLHFWSKTRFVVGRWFTTRR